MKIEHLRLQHYTTMKSYFILIFTIYSILYLYNKPITYHQKSLIIWQNPSYLSS